MKAGQSTNATTQSLRPLVSRPGSKRGRLLGLLAVTAAAVGLFAGLEARRTSISSPATTIAAGSNAGVIASPVDLSIPGPPAGAMADRPAWLVAPGDEALPVNAGPRMGVGEPVPRAARRAVPPAPEPSYASQAYVPPNPPPRYARSSINESEIEGREPPPRMNERGMRGGGQGIDERVHATMLANPSTTVPKGALIQAVLETAIDSSGPGPVRAIVSRNVYGFDGGRVLIPRGSRLYGEYKAEVAAGQNRALIQWQRLTRPDGAIVVLDSPSADPLGRAGVKGSVNSHFFERFGSAILQSTLDVGVALASRNVARGTVIVGLPGSSQSTSAAIPPNVKPTLKVRQGSPVSVFVARDLDFTQVEQ